MNKPNRVNNGGYILVYCPTHPKADKGGYIREHVLVAEAMVGRHLKDDEHVHHKDRNKKNNSPDNLQIVDPSEHLKLHGAETAERGAIRKQKNRERGLPQGYYYIRGVGISSEVKKYGESRSK